MIEKNYIGNEHKDLRIKLKAGGQSKAREVEVLSGENTEAVESYLVHEIKDILAKDENTSIAVITRRNRELERVLKVLESNNIPVSSERSIDIFHHPIGTLFFDLIEYINDSAKFDKLAKTIAAGMWNLPFNDSLTVIRLLRAGKTEGLESKIPGLVLIRNAMHQNSSWDIIHLITCFFNAFI